MPKIFSNTALLVVILLLNGCGEIQEFTPCNTLVSGEIPPNTEGSIVSADQKAVIVVDPNITAVSASITLNCEPLPEHIGNSYEIQISGSTSSVRLIIEYAGEDLKGATSASLQLGKDNPAAGVWVPEGNPTNDPQNGRFELVAPTSGRYAVYVITQ